VSVSVSYLDFSFGTPPGDIFFHTEESPKPLFPETAIHLRISWTVHHMWKALDFKVKLYRSTLPHFPEYDCPDRLESETVIMCHGARVRENFHHHSLRPQTQPQVDDNYFSAVRSRMRIWNFFCCQNQTFDDNFTQSDSTAYEYDILQMKVVQSQYTDISFYMNMSFVHIYTWYKYVFVKACDLQIRIHKRNYSVCTSEKYEDGYLLGCCAV
jgi:hypothetical protein